MVLGGAEVGVGVFDDVHKAASCCSFMRWYRSKSSEEQHALDIKTWVNACRDFPLWAVQKAAERWRKGAREGDDLAHFSC